MMLGMSLSTFTFVHVLISLVGIASGLIVLYGFLADKRMDGLTALFLTTTVLTSVTGFMFPFEHFSPADTFGVISLVVLTIAIAARYAFHLAGGWRTTFVVTSALALYLNCFVAVVQSFLKIPALHALAPQGKEPPFLLAQLVVFLIFVVLTILAAKKFRVQSGHAA